MTFKQAYQRLKQQWSNQSPEFKNKWAAYRSKWDNNYPDIHQKKIEEMLTEAGFLKAETWSQKVVRAIRKK